MERAVNDKSGVWPEVHTGRGGGACGPDHHCYRGGTGPETKFANAIGMFVGKTVVAGEEARRRATPRKPPPRKPPLRSPMRSPMRSPRATTVDVFETWRIGKSGSDGGARRRSGANAMKTTSVSCVFERTCSG